ncbi:MAG TPA: peptidyl-prolyl cis-trans isomerase [Thiothrix sp.]|nr:peptidyl-prolyl cis-trans isomerase [Thiothrix sp.]
MKHFVLILSLFFMSFAGCYAEVEKKAEAKPTGVKMSTNPHVKIETTMGDITLELDAKNAPISTENFLSYVKEGFYDGTIFHRIIPNFMVQGGGMNPDMSEKKTKATIKNEANNGLLNDRGTVAMARTNEPHSASSQFFINIKDNAFLNFKSEDMQGWGYAVFGKVIEGMDIVDKIVAMDRGNMGFHQDVPKESIIMNKVSIIE